MTEKISVDELSSSIANILEAYQGATEEVLYASTDKTADETVQELHNAHPSGAEQYGSWDAYNASWKKNTARQRKGVINSTVYNEKHYRLTHLLENGHAKVGGGRTRAFPHISIAEANAEKRFVEHISQGVENI